MLQVYVLLSRVLKLDGQTLEYHVYQLTWTLPLRAPAEKVECASRTAAENVCGLDVNQSLSQPTKYSPPTPHKTPELMKLQAASYIAVR